MNLKQVDPASYRAMGGLEQYLTAGGIDSMHRHLLKIRASQLNGCAYCVNMHVREAVADGESHWRLHALAVWKESPLFTEQEKALLALTEEVTFIHGRVSDETWARARRFWGEPSLAVILMAIITINAWNRIGVSLEMAPEKG